MRPQRTTALGAQRRGCNDQAGQGTSHLQSGRQRKRPAGKADRPPAEESLVSDSAACNTGANDGGVDDAANGYAGRHDGGGSGVDSSANVGADSGDGGSDDGDGAILPSAQAVRQIEQIYPPGWLPLAQPAQ